MTKTGQKGLRGKKHAMYEALKKELGVITAACKVTGLSRQTHYRWLKEDPEYKEWIEEVPEITLDFAENALLKNIQKGNVIAQIFYLKTKGKGRGYIEKQEIALSGSLAHKKDDPEIIKLIHKLPDKLREKLMKL